MTDRTQSFIDLLLASQSAAVERRVSGRRLLFVSRATSILVAIGLLTDVILIMGTVFFGWSVSTTRWILAVTVVPSAATLLWRLGRALHRRAPLNRLTWIFVAIRLALVAIFWAAAVNNDSSLYALIPLIMVPAGIWLAGKLSVQLSGELYAWRLARAKRLLPVSDASTTEPPA